MDVRQKIGFGGCVAAMVSSRVSGGKEKEEACTISSFSNNNMKLVTYNLLNRGSFMIYFV